MPPHLSSATPPQSDSHDLERWTRSQAADYLKVSVATVRRREDAGELNPVVDERGTWLHDPAEVRALARASRSVGDDGQRESDADDTPYGQVFELFDEGLDPVAVVRQLRIHPERIARALEWYQGLRDRRPVERELVDRVTDLEGIVAYMQKQVANLEGRVWNEGRCPQCGAFGPYLCEPGCALATPC